MSKDNSNFFEKKKIWSEVKDELLDCYLVPYFTKMMSTGKPTLYVDCFAGKGKFDDGKLGSPLTALQSLGRSLDRCHVRKPAVEMKFIEPNHHKALNANIPIEHRTRCELIEGRFEDKITQVLQNANLSNFKLNVFLYIDPYGIKALNASLFDSLAKACSTAELLINLNSFGFIREACRIMKIIFREGQVEIFSDLEEYDSSVLDSIQKLNAIAGDNYWQEIIDKYSSGKIDGYKAEKKFSQKYKEHLRQSYKYVLDMPIRLKEGQHPKYRMVHATNHPDGCVLMANNMAKRTDRLVVEIQDGGQLGLMPLTAENDIVSDDMLLTRVEAMLATTSDYVRLNEFLADFYNENGVLCGISRLSSGKGGSALKTLEKNGYIDVQRNPALTQNGKPSKFWQESKGNTLSLRKRK
ncbi:MAG: three-Cys-motif partner protein TcmP [Verrucomicrobiota bacterium]|jgi:three-Cys-motif partner protein|nr:three-Cys-motif partner protein TcmP [Verrucomicrobiota bacterium]